MMIDIRPLQGSRAPAVPNTLLRILHAVTNKIACRWGALKALVPALLLPFVGDAQTSMQVLTPGKITTIGIAKTATATFSLHPDSGRHYIIEAEQRGIDIALQLRTGMGRELANQDSPNGRYGPETIRFASGNDSTLTLVVAPLQDSANAATGKVSIVFKEERPAGAAANPVLSAKQMQRDLRVFRQIREKANSGFLRYHSKTEMDSVFHWAGLQVTHPMRLTEFFKIILTITDAEGSCHNSSTLPEDMLGYLPQKNGFFPYYMKRIGTRMIVNNAGGAIPLGARILSIDGMADSLIMHRFYKYLPTDGYNMTAKQRFSADNTFGWRYPLEFGIRDSFRVSYLAPGTAAPQTATIRSVSLAEKQRLYQERHSRPYDVYFDSNEGDVYSFSMPDSATAMLHFRRFDMAGNADDPAYAVFSHFLDSVFVQLKTKQIPNLIVDVRNNPGGSDPNYEKVFTYLTDHSFRENTLAWTLFDSIPLPEYYRWNSVYKDNQDAQRAELDHDLQYLFSVRNGDRYLQHPERNPVYQPDANRFTGNLYLLIDENVASAASHFASLVRGYSKATIVGVETTGGYYGHNGHFPVEYVLPESKIRTRFSIVHVDQDAPQLASQPVGRGIIPDVEVHQSFTDFMANADTQLKAVLGLIRERTGSGHD